MVVLRLGGLAVLHMSRGRGHRAIRVDGHDVKVAHRELLDKRAELVVDEVQQLLRVRRHVRLRPVVHAAVTRFVRVRHRDEVDILDLEPAHDGLRAEPQHFLKRQVGGNVVFHHAGKVADLRHVLELQKLLDHRL